MRDGDFGGLSDTRSRDVRFAKRRRQPFGFFANVTDKAQDECASEGSPARACLEGIADRAFEHGEEVFFRRFTKRLVNVSREFDSALDKH